MLREEILSELREEGLKEVLLFVGDGLKRFFELVKKSYPVSDFQGCILHKIRSTLNKVRKRGCEAIKEDIKRVYRQKGEEGFKKALSMFSQNWRALYPKELRPYIYTTNALEIFIKEVKRGSKVIEVFPTSCASDKGFYLIASEMNERYKAKALKNFSMVKKILLSIRRARYGEPIKIAEICATQNF